METKVVIHNSQKEAYRSPYGAVKTGTEVFLRIKTHTLEIENIDLRLWNGAREVVLPMLKVNDGYEVKFVPSEEPKNIWYYFIIHYYGGEVKYYGNNTRILGGRGELYDYEPPSYQITVYDKDMKTPSWYSQTTTYQIFVDRFYNSGKQKMYDNTQIEHKYWGESPIKNNLNNDFFGGDLEGIIEKLPYLKKLNISAIYLNPIFEASSNHKYNTKDFKKIDEHYGDEEIFKRLCKKANEAGIKVILDGVFNHVGNDSPYFQRAIQDENSPYFSWFNFDNYPTKYQCWWGIRTLPTLNKNSETLKNYLFRDSDSVIKKWLKAGASGYRIDVVDELPQKFVECFRENVKKTKKDAIVIGEVWEDASNKVSYGIPRRYFLGDELDGVMNYPLKNALISFIMGAIPGELFSSIYEGLKENYPQQSMYSCMNILGGHDIVRPKTIFGEAPLHSLADEEKVFYKLNPKQNDIARKRMKLASLIQIFFPGSPCIYYGDEAGAEGYEDPFNRAPFPWNNFDLELFDWYKSLTRKRAKSVAMKQGKHIPIYAEDSVYAFARVAKKGEKDAFGEIITGNESYVVAVNVSKHESKRITIDFSRFGSKKGFDGEVLLAPLEGKVFKL